MPELPEVENARQYLLRAGLVGSILGAPDITWPKTVRRPSVGEFIEGIVGRRVEGIQRRGKYLTSALDDGNNLILHLGMTGSLRITNVAQSQGPMVRHTFPLDGGRRLEFSDPRKFGHLWLLADPADAMPTMGPEPLEPSFTADVLAGILNGRRAPIKALLLEQSVVAGLGNLYADEALFLSGIHPERIGQNLTDCQIRRLHASIVSALSHSVGEYARARDAHWPDPPVALSPWSIRRSKGDLCPRCGIEVQQLRVRGRSSWFCPNCQPPP